MKVQRRVIDHEDGCSCVICSGEMTRKQLTAKEVQCISDFGWFAHAVVADPYVATGCNYHTHGFDQSLGHFDLQIVFPLRKIQWHSIAKTIYDQIKGGNNFHHGDETVIPHLNGCSSFRVRFIKVREGDRDVLRVILPSPYGGLEPEQVENDEPEYALQWSVSE